MTATWNPDTIRAARNRLQRCDATLKRVIRDVGEFSLKPQGRGYEMLVRSILSQQISTAAATTIRSRLMALLPGSRVRPELLDALSDEQLQGAGVSAQKRGYLRDLTRCTLDGTINFRRISRAQDEDAVAELLQVRGIGRWTAQMFLMFSLGRTDVFAPDDLGLKNAIIRLYQMEAPSRNQLEQLAERWAPYRSMAAWYLWRSLENS